VRAPGGAVRPASASPRSFRGPSLARATQFQGYEELQSESDVVALFDASEYEPADPHTNYDVGPDGRFVMVHQGRLSEMVLLLNWTEEVRRRSSENTP